VVLGQPSVAPHVFSQKSEVEWDSSVAYEIRDSLDSICSERRVWFKLELKLVGLKCIKIISILLLTGRDTNRDRM
jgi:hypothetical protein